jgi:carbon storage regulator
MLVLSRRVNERIAIGHGVILTVVRVGKTQIRFAIEAPADVLVHREEIVDRPRSACQPGRAGTGEASVTTD